MTAYSDPPVQQIIIVGCGFAGLHCAMRLATRTDTHVTVIDRNNYQQFQPLMYQVATGSLPPTDAAFNLRALLGKHKNVDVVLAEIKSVDPSTKTAYGSDGEVYRGDVLVLAAGAIANFFDTPGVEQYAFPLYSLADAERLKSKLLETLEKADHELSLGRDSNPHFAIIGGGATGVEISGALADIFQRASQELFKHLDIRKVRVTLVNGEDTVLTGFQPRSQEYAKEILGERGVTLSLKRKVREITQTEMLLDDGTRLPCDVVIWAGGLKASPLAASLGLTQGKGGRIDVRDDLQVEGYPDVYALGDFANTNGKDGKSLPQLGSVAQQAGKHCANNILASMDGKETKPFSYVDKGIMAMIGRNAAVAEMGSTHHSLTGPVAFAAWLGVHALLLASTHAKIEAFFEWAWEYFGQVHVAAILDGSSDRPSAWHPNTSTSD